MLIFKFSNIKSDLFVLFACMPPTLAAQFTKTSGFVSLIRFSVSALSNKFVSFLELGTTELTFGEFLRTLITELPTKPSLPVTKTFIFL